MNPLVTSDALDTDHYKFVMAEVGSPLRDEVFEFVFRKGGPYFLPVDIESYVRGILPEFKFDHFDYLEQAGCALGAGARLALSQRNKISVRGLPDGSWFLAGEPVCTVRGPSAIASWPEAKLTQLRFRIQVCTKLLLDYEGAKYALKQVANEEERAIVQWCCERVCVSLFPIKVDPEEYYNRCASRADALILATGSGDRIFESGLRSATCMSSYELAVKAWVDAGIKRTCGVSTARKLGAISVGTMGHEHPQRCRGTRPRWVWTAGEADRAAYLSMIERRPGPSTCLLDTTDTERSGVPAAIDVMRQYPERNISARPDSDLPYYFPRNVEQFGKAGLYPKIILENEGTVESTVQFEEVRRKLHCSTDRVDYGFGGFAHPGLKYADIDLHRNGGSVVYKLCWSDGPTMKFGNEPRMAGTKKTGKASIPGKPVSYRRVDLGAEGWSLVAQDGEVVPSWYRLPLATDGRPPKNATVDFSVKTQTIIDQCEATREEMLAL